MVKKEYSPKRKQSRKQSRRKSPRNKSPRNKSRRKSPRNKSRNKSRRKSRKQSRNKSKRKSIFSMNRPNRSVEDDKHFPRVLGVNGLIGQYAKASNYDSETFNQFFNGTNVEKGENLYFISLKALFTTRLQDEYLDKKSKEKYIVQSIIIYKDDTDTEEYKSIDYMKNIDDTDNIIIKCGRPSHVWIYVTNNNWDNITYLIKKYKYKNVSFFGPVNKMIDKVLTWLCECNSLKSIDFTGLNKLKTVGNEWIYKCKNLESIDFTGLINLKTVGGGWMEKCLSLENVNFRGLNKLKTVGDWWMSYCKNLEKIDFTGLSSLKGVGKYWMSDCKNLKNIDFTGLSSLKSIGNGLMSECENLESVDFTGLSSLESIGNGSMSECDLKRINIKTGNLHNIKRLLDISNNEEDDSYTSEGD